MKRIRVVAGGGYNQFGQRNTVERIAHAIQSITDWAVVTIGGLTIYKSHGAWKAPNGEIVYENGLVFEYVGNDDLLAQEFARRIRDGFDQQSVLLTVENVEAFFV